ncbi:hypothetical protein AX15_001264 [Amanita polypyramis BW_CC]|nr:hypothetical protein AX15_001264 [Amanita polypyramis BW_CC]
MIRDRSDLESLYEQCGTLIKEGFVFPLDDEDYGGDDEVDFDEMISDATSSAGTVTYLLPSRHLPPGPVPPPMPQTIVYYDPITELPIPPYVFNRAIIPSEDPQTHNGFDFSPEGYIHLDPTRPNPKIHYRCTWGHTCSRYIHGGFEGRLRMHMRARHGLKDGAGEAADSLIRCEYSVAPDRICGAMVPARTISRHVVDEHWLSRRVRCPFCAAWQKRREDVPGHWFDSCTEYVKASLEERVAWRMFWKWPMRVWTVDRQRLRQA